MTGMYFTPKRHLTSYARTIGRACGETRGSVCVACFFLSVREGGWPSTGAQITKSTSVDPVIVEMRRIRPYYRGTRLLTTAGFPVIAAAFVLPLSVLFVEPETFTLILIVYAITFVTASIAGMIIQSAIDAVFALQHERKLTFRRYGRIGH